MSQIIVPTQPMQLVSAIPGTDLWQDMTPWSSTVGIVGIRGVLILAEKLNNFRVRIGIQTAASDVELPDGPVNPSDTPNVGTAYVSTITKNYYNFDPTTALNGTIGTKGYFRVGVLYSSTDATISRGNVILRVGYKC